MISADVIESMQKILPVEQNLVPVSFKKKLEYTGHYQKNMQIRRKLKFILTGSKNTIICMEVSSWTES